MENILKKELGVKTVKCVGSTAGGCISDGQSFETELGKYFLKVNTQSEAKRMFDGEFAGLQAIQSTDTIKVPSPVNVVPHPSSKGSIFIMEHIDMRGLGKHSAKLGENLARLHLHNDELRLTQEANQGYVGKAEAVKSISQFGFHITTCCGYLPMNNEWKSDWLEFYAQHRLKMQLDMIEREYNDRETRDLWPQVERRIPEFFKSMTVRPALLHGDLWSGNTQETDTEPVIFDPASFYGHSEYELGIAGMFGGFGRQFYDAYHSLIPKQPGHDKRQKLYQLFHYLNHWNHFGSGYRGRSVTIMKELLR
ncbi:ketosamine-3-kinase-like [Anneissia japonica]|uniref:ketosamine-3-kinase-like n=1 Tax=Anneissia japonica TaxID=1529436 RepID=UPI001425AD3A|nr:ketosamine-3-kinase-like [Anneissia japonica]